MVGLLIELRRSPAWTALLLVPLHWWLATDLVGNTDAVWNQVAAGVVSGGVIVGPLAAGIAAWTAVRERRRRTGHLRLTGARHPAVAPALELAVVLAWPLVGYLIVAAGLLTMTAFRATWGAPPLWWVAAGGAGLMLMVTVGWCAGRLLPHPWTAPTVALGLYLYCAWNMTQYGERWYPFAPGIVQHTSLFRRLNFTLFQAQLVWYVATAGLLLVAWVLMSTRPRTIRLTAGVVALGLASAGSSVILVGQQGQYFAGPATFTYACAGSRPQVCVHPAFAGGRSELLAEFTKLERKVAGTPADFHRVEQRPRGVGWQPSPGAGRYSIDGLASGFAKAAVGEYLDWALGAGDRCFQTHDETSMQRLALLSVVRAWLSDDPTVAHLGDPQVETVLRDFAGWPEESRRAWFVGHFSAVKECSLTAADFAS